MWVVLFLALQEEPIPDFVPQDDFVPRPLDDRWRPELPVYPFTEPGSPLDPYNRNLLKGDFPIIDDDVFFVFTGVLDVIGELRTKPKARGGGRFSDRKEVFVNANAFATLEFFEGESAFRPRDWEVRATGAYNQQLLDQDGRNVNDDDTALQEAFAGFRIADISDQFDFVFTRVGIQPFNSDFRGFLFVDTNVAARLFGTADTNRIQWNVAAFDLQEKDTLSNFNKFDRRDQQVYLGNVFLFDWIEDGHVTEFSLHHNRDPRVDVTYAGWAGDGYFGPVNLTHQVYVAFGEDDANPIAGRSVDVFSQFAAVEASHDIDWLRVRGSVLWASGDDSPLDGDGRGFDAIFENPNFAGGGFSYWVRQAQARNGVVLVNGFGLLPSLRGKAAASVNSVNPGLFLYNVGFDMEVLPEMKTFTNFNYLRFHHPEALEAATGLADVDREIGLEGSVGVQFRPFLNNNLFVTIGASALLPGEGYRDLFGDGSPVFHSFFEVTAVF